jgi:RNA polymerase sigma-70 factor (ECF subfamily)
MATFPTPPDEQFTLELLGQIREGDQEAWDRLYRRYHDELLFAVRARLGGRLRSYLESEDVLQSVALEAFVALPNFEHRGQGSLRHFLHRLILNKIRDRADYFGAQKRSGSVPLTDQLEENLPTGQDEPQYLDGDKYDRLEQGLQKLPEDLRTVVILRKVEGLSSKEAATEMGKSDVATRKLYSRAMAKLAALM